MFSVAINGIALLGFLALYFGLPYLLLKRGLIVRAGLVMLAISVFGLGLVILSGNGFGASALPLLLLPLPVLLTVVGTIVAVSGRSGRPQSNNGKLI